jgi:hypothetical protein
MVIGPGKAGIYPSPDFFLKNMKRIKETPND